MRDEVYIQVGNQKFENWLEYRLPQNIFVPDSQFSFKFAVQDLSVNEGDLIKCFVNGKIELTGIIERIEEDDSKSERSLTVSGRDLFGMATSSYVEYFKSMNGKNLEEITKLLTKDVQFFNRSNILFESDSEKYNISKKYAKAEIGETIFQRLSRIATSKRLLFFAESNGDLVYAKLPTEKKKDFQIKRFFNDSFKEVLKAKKTKDITNLFSEARIYSQSNEGNNTESIYKLPDSTIRKIFVGQFNEDEESAKEQARAVIEQQKKDSLAISYDVAGHSQKGENWKVRKGVLVDDQRFKINDTLLIFGRTMIGNKKSGQKTELVLGKYADR